MKAKEAAQAEMLKESGGAVAPVATTPNQEPKTIFDNDKGEDEAPILEL